MVLVVGVGDRPLLVIAVDRREGQRYTCGLANPYHIYHHVLIATYLAYGTPRVVCGLRSYT